MKLITFRKGGAGTAIGVLTEAGGVDLASIDPDLPSDMVEFISLGEAGLDTVRRGVDAAPVIDDVHLVAPIPRPPSNVMAVGRNYRDHAAEFSDSGFDASEKQMIPDHPIIFTKSTSSIVGPGDAIDTANDPTGTPDYEAELGVVIGRGGLQIPKDRAMDHVYGYTIINDVTARDLQKRHVQWFVGKSPATFCPMGPCLVTRDELPAIEESWLRCTVNGEDRQEAPISALIFDIPTLIATISSAVLLQPGDVIATGTPKGVGIGFEPPVFLKPGDVVEITIDGIGTLTNPVV